MTTLEQKFDRFMAQVLPNVTDDRTKRAFWMAFVAGASEMTAAIESTTKPVYADLESSLLDLSGFQNHHN